MSVILIRAVMLYGLVIFAVRLMGKRQLGELQPSELVITILVSNIATLPLEDPDIPLIVGVTPILALVCFEIIMSWLSLHFPRLRKFVSGSPKIVISEGRINADVMRELRFSVDDLLMSLRGKDIFDLEDVQYAVVETTGSISVMKKTSRDTPVLSDLGIEAENDDPPQLIVSDGKLIPVSLKTLGLDEAYVTQVLSAEKIDLGDILIMTADRNGKYFIADKKGGIPHISEGGKK